MTELRSFNISSKVVLLLVCVSMLVSSSVAAPIRMSPAARRKTNSIQLNRRLDNIVEERRLKKKKKDHPHHRHSHNVTNSCTSYTCSQLESAWNFPGDIPECPGKNCTFSSTSGTSSGSSGDDDTGNDDIYDDTVDDAIEEIIDFSVGNCTAYSNYWLWDLALTCDSEKNLTNCECTTAAILMSEGQLQCPNGTDTAPYCPKGCSICDTCLTLLGCSETQPSSPFSGRFSMSMWAYIIAAVAGILLGVAAMMVHSKKEEKPLEENLVDGAVPPAGDQDNVWLAPVSE